MAAEPVPGLRLPELADSQFRLLQRLMLEASGIALAANKRPLVAGRLMKRLRHYQLPGYEQYLQLLEQPQHLAERRLVVDLLTTNETYFFREPAHFAFLASGWPSAKARCGSGARPVPPVKSPTAWRWRSVSTGPPRTGRSWPAT